MHVSRSITSTKGKDSSFSTRQRELVFAHVQGHDLMYNLYYHYCYFYLISLSVKKEFLRADSILISDDMIYFLTAIGLSPGGRSRVHIYTKA